MLQVKYKGPLVVEEALLKNTHRVTDLNPHNENR